MGDKRDDVSPEVLAKYPIELSLSYEQVLELKGCIGFVINNDEDCDPEFLRELRKFIDVRLRRQRRSVGHKIRQASGLTED